MKRTAWLMLAFVAVFLTGCPDTRVAINFDTDSRVLRGSWNFVLSDLSSNTAVSTQAVVFTPTFVSDREYAVAASVMLNGEVYALTGTVYGVGVKFIRSQTSFRQPVELILAGQSSGKKYFASLGTPSQFEGPWKYGGRLSAEMFDANSKPENYGLEFVRN